MPRFAFQIEYNGAPYAGWQRQNDRPSVQETIETALAKLQPGPHNIAAAGRTDKGVHATAQVAHVDLSQDWDTFRLTEALNFHLKPAPVAIVGCAKVPDDWHARFWATRRHYTFRMVSRRAPVVHEAGLVWQVRQGLDVQAMQDGANRLLGTHDFTTFRATMCQAKSPVKTLDHCQIEVFPYPHGTEYRFHLHARSFLHNQVRSIVGTLERVGAGTWTPDDVAAALAAKDRDACGPVCPAHGLYLSHVDYDEPPF